MKVIKRTGEIAEFSPEKIETAIQKAFLDTREVSESMMHPAVCAVADCVLQKIGTSRKTITVEEIQDFVESALMEKGYEVTAKSYIIFRQKHQEMRAIAKPLENTLKELLSQSSLESDLKRDNANIDGNSSMGTMLQVGSATTKAFAEENILRPEQAKAHREGDIHIHDFDFYMLTETCTQIDIVKLFKNGFSTGHGFLREPNSITSYAALAAIAIQSNQNDQHGGQSIPNFDYGMALGVQKTYIKEFKDALTMELELAAHAEPGEYKDAVSKCIDKIKNENDLFPRLQNNDEFDAMLEANPPRDIHVAKSVIKDAHIRAWKKTDRATYQAMEGFIHNLNTMHSRAGAQVPFSSINYGTDMSEEGRMVIKNVLLAEDAGLGNGETPIFPIQIFKVKEGVNYNSEDKNYDLFKLSMKVSAKRLFPNYVFLDSPFNLQYYKPGKPETEVATMGCRTRVMGNVNGPEISYSRGNLSFTSINLPRIAIDSKGDEKVFYKKLDKMLELVAQQLLDRYKIQSHRRVYNYPFLMGQGVWLDSDKLAPDDEVGEVLKHGSLSIGFIGLAETLTAMYGHHHGEGKEYWDKGYAIVKHMRDFCDKKIEETHLNFGLLATPAEGLSGRFTRIDKKKYGEIKNVTDRDYYTNSFHIPVWYPISAYEKIQLEAPFHALCNSGHISYVELDGDTANNIEAFESVIRCMHDAGIGYGSINHPVDRDPICGYTGVIGDTCPRCGRRNNEALTKEQLDDLRKRYPSAPVFTGKV